MSSPPKTVFHRASRILFTAAAVSLGLWLTWISLNIGFSRILTRYALSTGSIPAASEAMQLSPPDAEAHLAKAILLRASGALAEALPEFERATALRPRDYDLWLQLAMARDEGNDPNGALSAFNEAVRLAPYYAQPHWQRGNLLLRSGAYDEAFKDLRAAAESNPDFVPSLIDLSWGVARGDPKTAEQLAQPTTSAMKIAFAQYLARQGRGDEAVTYFRSAGLVSEDVKRQFVSDLIRRNLFAQAFEIWSGRAKEEKGPESIYDGGFEGTLNLDETGFGWRVPPAIKGASFSLDTVHPQTGAKALRIDFTGESNPEIELLSQLLLLTPSRTYRISFAARTKEIVTGGLPLANINSAQGDRALLGHSILLPQGTSDWRTMEFEFTTGPSTAAVVLSIKRQSCTTSPCPAFGTLWLDSFGLQVVGKD